MSTQMAGNTHLGSAQTARPPAVAQVSGVSRRQAFGVGLAPAGGLAGLLSASCGRAGESPGTGAQVGGKVRWLTRPNPVENAGQTEVFIPGFKRLHPTVEIELTITPAGEDYVTKFYALTAAGEGPDIWGFGGNYAGYWARGLTADLTPLITRDRVDLAQFHKGLPELFRYRGKHYGLPQLTTFGTLTFYNKDLFAQAGLKPPPVDWDDHSWTVDAMLEVARKLTKHAGTPDAVYGLSFGPWGPHDVAWLWGGDSWLPEHYAEHIAPRSLLDSGPSIEGHQFWQDVRWKHHVMPRPGVDPTAGISFATGRYAMVVGGGWNFWGFTTIKDFTWAAAALPSRVANKNSNYNDFWHLASYSKNKDGTWAFMKYLTSVEAQRAYSQQTGTPPTVKGAMEVWYQRYDGLMTRAELEKVTQGAIEPKRSVCSPAHHFVEYIPPVHTLYTNDINGPISRNEGSAREIIWKQKSQLDALLAEIHDRWKGRLPG